jgi:hypothetical protein
VACTRQKEKHTRREETQNIKVTLRPVRYADETTMMRKNPEPIFDGDDAENAKAWKKGAESRGYNAAL